MSKNGFVIYKASGGLAHSLGGLFRAITVAQKLKRKLIIDYNVHKAFENSFSKFFHIIGVNYEVTYDCVPRTLSYRGHTIDELKNERLGERYSIFGTPAKRPNPADEIVVVAGTSGRKGWVSIDELRVNNDILEKLSKEPIIKEKYIAVHFRNTDITSNIGRQSSLINAIRKETKINTLYLSSDDYLALSKWKKVFPNMKIIMLTNPEKDVHNIHYGSKDKTRQVYECLRDCYMILKSDYFVPCTTSGLSRMLIMMMRKKINMFSLPAKTIPVIQPNDIFDFGKEEYVDPRNKPKENIVNKEVIKNYIDVDDNKEKEERKSKEDEMKKEEEKRMTEKENKRLKEIERKRIEKEKRIKEKKRLKKEMRKNQKRLEKEIRRREKQLKKEGKSKIDSAEDERLNKEIREQIIKEQKERESLYKDSSDDSSDSD